MSTREAFSYFRSVSYLVGSYASDIEVHCYYDDVSLDQQRRLERLVAILRDAASLAQQIDADRQREARELGDGDAPPAGPLALVGPEAPSAVVRRLRLVR
jgi:hypothetical protein